MKLTSEYDQHFIEAQIRAHRTGVTRRQFVAGAAAGAAALGLAACGTGSDDASADGKKVLRWAQKNQKQGIDPHVVNDQNSYTLSDMVCEAPLMWTEDNELVPCFTTKMPEVSADGLTYKLELKDKIPCHDGSNLTAKDVKFSVERMLWPETKYKSPYMLNQIKGAADVIAGTTRECTGVVADDDTHVTITLEKPYSSFLSILGTVFFECFPQAAVEKAGSAWGTGTNLVGSGPFKITSNDDSTKLTYEKFDQYHGTPANVDEVDVTYVDDPNTKMMSYVNGDLDLCDVDPSQFEQYQNDATVKDQLHEYDPLGTYFLNLNLSSDKLKDVRVRQAISLAVNRQEIVDTVLHGGGIAANGYLNPKIPGYDSSADVLEYNPDKAKELLAEAGASGLTLDCPVRATEQAVAVALQGYLEAVGITLNVSTMDSAMWSDRWRGGQLETTVLSWNILFPDGDMAFYTYFYSESAAQKGSFYNSPDFDKLLLEARDESDDTKRADLYKQANKLLVDQDWATCPLYYPKRFFAAKPWVKNMKVGNLVFHFRDVDIDLDEKAKASK